ncbi:MAG: hypothetical protein N4A49_01825 [Marinifilaceae bacterium]|jgi:transposase|nr:hypothetical protein [Marinifilaceae bacterium]
MKKQNYSKLKQLAERMFFEGDSNTQIAEDLNLSKVTISKWRKLENWDERKAELTASPHKIKELLLKELQKLSNGETSSINADAISKLSRVIEAVSGKVSTQVVITVFKEFDNWMSSQDPEMAIQFTEFHKQFVLYKASLES